MKSTIIIAAALVAGCAAPPADGPEAFAPGTITLRVMNSTPSTIGITGYPDFNPAVPQPLGGLLGIGTAGPGTSCLAVPHSMTLTVNKGTNAEMPSITWTTAQGLSLALHNAPADASNSPSLSFVPDSSAGWSMSISNAGATLTPASVCVP